MAGNVHRQVGNEVHLAGANEAGNEPRDIGLNRCALPDDQGRGEHAIDLPTQPIMRLAITVEHRELHKARMIGHIVEIVLALPGGQLSPIEDAVGHARQARIGNDGGDVALARHQQHAELGEWEETRKGAHLCICRIRIGSKLRRERIESEGRCVDRHRALSLRRRSMTVALQNAMKMHAPVNEMDKTRIGMV